MSKYTFASVIIPDSAKEQAQADLSEYQFTAPLSPTGEAPATHWMSSGPWDDAQLQFIVNEATWPYKVYFGTDWQAAVAAEGLMPVVEKPEPEPEPEPEEAQEPEPEPEAQEPQEPENT